MKSAFLLRPLQDSDLPAYSQMLYDAFNAWYRNHGWGRDYFSCQPAETAIFYEMYRDLTPGHSIAAFDPATGRLAGACFYHPRECHVSLGIMCVHPDFWGLGVGRQLVSHILAFTREHGYRSCRLVSSALNLDSFSLYNQAGFIPRACYHDMLISVPATGLACAPCDGEERVREARPLDTAAMGDLEMEVSGIRRAMDYAYAIDNPRGLMHAAVFENDQQQIDGFMLSVRHPALNMLGPCVARTEEIALALIRTELERFRGAQVLLVVPADQRVMVERLYAWKAKNIEIHLKGVWGDFPGFKGVSMPSFLPETG